MAANVPSSPTLHQAVHFRTLSCGPGRGSTSGSTKQAFHQFYPSPSGSDAGASDRKGGHLSLSRSHLRSLASQRWQEQIWPALRRGSTTTSMSEYKLEQDLSGFAEEAECRMVRVELFTAVVDGGDLISSMALSGGMGIYLLSVQELRDEWESQLENRQFYESVPRAGAPSLLELSRGRRLWQCCCGVGGKECSDRNYVSDSLVDPVLLTIAKALDNKGRPMQWEGVKEGKRGKKSGQRVTWWRTSGGNHFAIIAGPASGGREAYGKSQDCTGIHFVNLENFESWIVQLLRGSGSLSTLSIIELQIAYDDDSQDEKGKTTVMQLEERGTQNEGSSLPVSLKMLFAASIDPPTVHCLVLEYGVESDDPHMVDTQPASMMNRHWLRSKENSFNGEGKSWAWWSGGNKRSSNGHLGGILQLQPPEEVIGGSLSCLSVIAPSHIERYVQLIGLVHDGSSIVYLQASALDIVAALTPTEANHHHDNIACLPLRIVSVHNMSIPTTMSLKLPSCYVRGGDQYQPCFVASNNEVEDVLFVFENHHSIQTTQTQQPQRLSPLALLLPEGTGPVCGIVSTASCGGIVDGNIVALVWSRTAVYYMRMGGKIGKDIKTDGHMQIENDLARPGLSPDNKSLQSIVNRGKLTRRGEKVRQDWISTLRSARALWSQGDCCHAVRQLAGAVRWAAKLPSYALVQAATKAVQFEMVDTLLRWLVGPELREQDELLQQNKLECFLKEDHVLESQVVITRLIKAGLLHHAVLYASHRGSWAITSLCNTLSSEIGAGFALSPSDVVALCNSDSGASTALATSAHGYLLESLPVLAQVEVGLGDRALLRSYPSLSWRLTNLLWSLDTYCLASIAARLAQWWAYDSMDAGDAEMKNDYLNLLLEVLLETSRWGNFDNAEWWQLMTMGCEVSSRVNEQLSIGIKSLTRQTIAVSVEDSARGLLKAIQTEPLLALAGSGPNKPGDSEGSSSTPRTTTDDTIKLASGAQRVLLAVLPLLKGYFDSCGLFLHAFDAGNWPLCASIMELENCPVEADTMRLCGVLALLQPYFPTCNYFSVLSGSWNASDATTSSTMTTTSTTSAQKAVAQQTTVPPPDGANMDAACSSFMLQLVDIRSSEDFDNSVASVVLAKVCCLWQHLQFPVKDLLHHLSALIGTSSTLCSALGKALYPQLDKQNIANRRNTYGNIEERQFEAVKSLPFDQTVRLKVLSHVWERVMGTTTPLKDDGVAQPMSSTSSQFQAECIQLVEGGGPAGHSIPTTMLLKPFHEQQQQQQRHQEQYHRRGDVQHTAKEVVAFSCGHTMSRDKLIHTTLPVLPSFIDSCTKSLQMTSELLVHEYTKQPVMALSCPSCLIEALQKISQLDSQSISNWMLG